MQSSRRSNAREVTGTDATVSLVRVRTAAIDYFAASLRAANRSNGIAAQLFHIDPDEANLYMQNPALTRRALLGGLAGWGLVGCGTSPTLDLIGKGFSGAAARADAYPLSAERIRALPYASLGVRIGNSAPGVMILATYDGENLNWASSDRVILVTRRGRLVKTVGLERDLVGTQWTGADPVIDSASGASSIAEARVNRFIDVRPDDAFGVAVESSVRLRGQETITILDRSFDAMLISEKVAVPQWRWSAENLFWVDRATGRLLRSRQSYCPEVPAITLETLKPAAETTRIG